MEARRSETSQPSSGQPTAGGELATAHSSSNHTPEDFGLSDRAIPPGGFFWSRRAFLSLGAAFFAGCKSFFGKDDESDAEHFKQEYFDVSRPRFIGEIAGVWGTNFAKVEGISLVTNLSGTGSSPPADDLRRRLLNEMKIHDIPDANAVLNDPNTSLVIVRGLLPPGIQKGDTYDVEVYVPRRSDTKSLHGGTLLSTRLTTAEVVGAAVRTGHLLSMAKGSILVDSVFWEGDDTLELHGRVLGGGVALQNRPIGLFIRDDAQSVVATVRIARTINERFDTYFEGARTGVATPKDNKIIELMIPKQYQHNIGRYLQVIRHLSFNETAAMRGPLLEELAQQLGDPLSAGTAAARLEAIGRDAQPILLRGLSHPDPEVRFLSAEGLAYQGVREAASVLGEIANNIPTFRWHAITALASMDDVEAGAALEHLLNHPDIETRYGAFRAMLVRSPYDPTVSGRNINNEFRLHSLNSSGPPALHFSRVRQPEVVIFGHDQRVSDQFLYVGTGLTVKGMGDGSLQVSKYDPSGDQVRTTSTQLEELIFTLGALGVRYGEMLRMFRQVDANRMLAGQLAVHAIPDPNRRYNREPGQLTTAQPDLPSLFNEPIDSAPDWRNDSGQRLATESIDQLVPEESPNLFERVGGWFSR
ncbi:MAG: flagellar basal body P-ring protein FlgI [Planctomycetales bacterium]|nr:flagellar basal body P-ring protein FlgI [Planctomycetales bacterium]